MSRKVTLHGLAVVSMILLTVVWFVWAFNSKQPQAHPDPDVQGFYDYLTTAQEDDMVLGRSTDGKHTIAIIVAMRNVSETGTIPALLGLLFLGSLFWFVSSMLSDDAVLQDDIQSEVISQEFIAHLASAQKKDLLLGRSVDGKEAIALIISDNFSERGEMTFENLPFNRGGSGMPAPMPLSYVRLAERFNRNVNQLKILRGEMKKRVLDAMYKASML